MMVQMTQVTSSCRRYLAFYGTLNTSQVGAGGEIIPKVGIPVLARLAIVSHREHCQLTRYFGQSSFCFPGYTINNI